MKKKSELIEDLADMGSRFALSVKDGTYYEGHILEINEDSFEFGLGGPMASNEAITIKYDNLDFESLSFFDSSEKCYKDAVWIEAQNKWVITKSK